MPKVNSDSLELAALTQGSVSDDEVRIRLAGSIHSNDAMALGANWDSTIEIPITVMWNSQRVRCIRCRLNRSGFPGGFDLHWGQNATSYEAEPEIERMNERFSNSGIESLWQLQRVNGRWWKWQRNPPWKRN